MVQKSKTLRIVLVLINYILAFTKVYDRLLVQALPSYLWSGLPILVYTGATLLTVLFAFPTLLEDGEKFHRVDGKSVLMQTIAIGLISFVVIVIFYWFRLAPMVPETFENDNTLYTTVFLALTLVPLNEEIVFRWALYGIASRRSATFGAVTSSILYAALHVYLRWDVGTPDVIMQLIIYFILGLGCATAYQKKENLWHPLLIHYLWNIGITGLGLLQWIAARS